MKSTKRVLSLLLSLVLTLALLPAALAAIQPPDQGNVLVTEAIPKTVAAYAQEKTLASWWDIVALSAANTDVKAAGYKLPDLTEASLQKTPGSYASRILTLVALGENPRLYYKNLDLVSALSAMQKPDGSFGYLNDDIYATLALEKTAPEGYRRDAAFSHLCALQLKDGGFAFSGDSGDVDMTGMALLVLGADSSAAVKAAADKAVAFLYAKMTPTGGFVSPWSETKVENACSAAAALSGLSAVKQQTGEKGILILKNLLSFQTASGRFCSEAGGKDDAFSTQQALIALGDYMASSSVFVRGTFVGEPYKLPALALIYADASAISSWAVTSVELAAQKGLMVGSGGKFNPKGNLTRAEMATLLYNMGGKPDVKPQKLTDVAEGKWYTTPVYYAFSAGLMDGVKGAFRPEAPVTREEVAAAIARLYKLDTDKAEKAVKAGTLKIGDFASVSAASKPYVAAVFYEGIMVGNGVNFRPLANITREEVAKVLASLYE